MKSLGLSKEELQTKLMHLSYDGVYATAAERLDHVGGGLSLVSHVEDYLEVERGEITSAWDICHKVFIS